LAISAGFQTRAWIPRGEFAESPRKPDTESRRL
jgi:hypothetical protein